MKIFCLGLGLARPMAGPTGEEAGGAGHEKMGYCK